MNSLLTRNVSKECFSRGVVGNCAERIDVDPGVDVLW